MEENKTWIGVTRAGAVYELFFSRLPQQTFTASDVVALYLHRGAFETTLADEDQEIDPDRWVSHTAMGQEVWQLISQWVWNLRLELGHQLHPDPVRTTEFAPTLPSAHKETPAQAPVQPTGCTTILAHQCLHPHFSQGERDPLTRSLSVCSPSSGLITPTCSRSRNRRSLPKLSTSLPNESRLAISGVPREQLRGRAMMLESGAHSNGGEKASSVTFSGNGLLTVCRRKARSKKFFSLQCGTVLLRATGKQIVFPRQENNYEKALGEGVDDSRWSL